MGVRWHLAMLQGWMELSLACMGRVGGMRGDGGGNGRVRMLG